MRNIDKKKVGQAFDEIIDDEGIDTGADSLDIARKYFQMGVELALFNGTQFLGEPFPHDELTHMNYNG